MHYNSFNDYMKNKYGTKVYKLSLSCSSTCPNRDGSVSFGGCAFCAEGSGTFASSPCLSIEDQIECAKKLVSKKLTNVKSPKYIGYFQSFTSTYVDPFYLRECLLSCANDDEIVELRIATRPDCLGNDILKVLEEISEIKPVSVELGLQTSNDVTAEYFNRGYKTEVFKEAVNNLKKIGIKSICHIIIGLPNPKSSTTIETLEDIFNTIDFASRSGVFGIKLQLLHVLSGTKFEVLYNEGIFKTLTLEEYTDILCECIEIIPDNIIIERITGDPPKKLLVAPYWSSDKKRVMNYINKTLIERNIIQGSKCYEK